MSIRVKKLTSHAAAPQSASVLQRIAETEAERGRTLVNLRRSSLARLEEMQDAHDAAMLSRAELEATRQAATARALGATLNNIFTAGYLQSMQALGMLAAGQHVSFGKFIGQFLTTAGAAFAVLGVLFVAVPVGAYQTLAPRFESYLGSCGRLPAPEDPHHILIPVGRKSGGQPTIEVLDRRPSDSSACSASGLDRLPLMYERSSRDSTWASSMADFTERWNML